jgi:hypothetical protein
MRKSRVKYVAAFAAVGVLGIGGAAAAHDRNSTNTSETLRGYEEVPALSTPGSGDFRAALSRTGDAIRYRLSFDNLESPVTQAHIHFENATNNGPVVVFLCSNLGNGPAGTQPCPADGGTIRGTIMAANVGDGAADQGLDAGEFEEFAAAIDSGATYVNVHTTGHPGGEIRAQLDGDDEHGWRH